MEEKQTYTGWVKWHPTKEELERFYGDLAYPFEKELTENQYLIVYDLDNTPSYYCYEHGKLRPFKGRSIKTFREGDEQDGQSESSSKEKKSKKKSSYSKGKQALIYPRNDEQVCAFDLIKDEEKTIKLFTGAWGSGKTLILVTAALEALRLDKFEKIIWIRNNVDVKDTKDLGALPGEIIDKLLPYLGPFVDHAGEDSVRTMINKKTLQVEPLQSLRGRNFENTLIMCSEAENLTKEHLQLIIARAAEGSQVWLDGDWKQRDRTVFEKSRGLETLIERLAGEELFGYVHLIKSERSATARLADKLDN